MSPAKRVTKVIKATKATPKATSGKFTIDCTGIEADNIISSAGLEKFLIDTIKVNGKTGNFEKVNKETGKVEKAVVVGRQGSKIMVDAVLPFKKRYLKFLTKKYLRRQQIRDFLRVVATGPGAYTLKYYLPKSKLTGED